MCSSESNNYKSKNSIADEPTGALDSKSAKQLLMTFDYLHQKLNATI